MQIYDEWLDFTDKVAVVTGASRGIGEAIARQLARRGATVVISSRKQAGCDQVAHSIVSAGGRGVAIACHIGDPLEIDDLFNQVMARLGRVDILVNNAATNPYFGPIVNAELSAFQKTMDVNLRGSFLMSQKAAKIMANQGGGSIINIASVNAEVPGFYQGIYSMTKAALVSMTKAFAKECAADQVRVNVILPGITDTHFASALINHPEAGEQMLSSIPMDRVAQPDEIAGAALYLASNASSYTTGSALTVDGGFLVY